MEKKNTKPSIPDAYLLLSSLRAVGYIEETAIADIVDNCISAGASEIRITFDWDNKRISIFDNGTGMDRKDLYESMKIGSSDPTQIRELDDLGRFGMGMKTAAFSIGKKLDVVTKKNNEIARACWDLDYIQKTHEWDLIVDEDNDETIIISRSMFEKRESGTIVFIGNLDKLIDDNNLAKSKIKFYNVMDRIHKHLSLVFHRFINEEGLKISINTNEIMAWDPFIIENVATQELSVEQYNVEGRVVSIEPYVLPHRSKFRSDDEFKDSGGIKGWLQHQGFYVYRNKRLLVYGTWFGLFKKEPSYNLARIKLDITSESDFDWNIDIKKSKALPPVYLEDIIEQIASICAEKSAMVYNSRGAYTKGNSTGLSRLSYVWEQGKNSLGEYRFHLNKKHTLLANLKKTLDDDGRNMLNTYLSLVENLSPVMISGVTDSMHNPHHGEKKIDEIEVEKELVQARNLIKVFIQNGYSKEEVLVAFADMKTFTHLYERIKTEIMEGIYD